jgi:hypothetical protein
VTAVCCSPTFHEERIVCLRGTMEQFRTNPTAGYHEPESRRFAWATRGGTSLRRRANGNEKESSTAVAHLVQDRGLFLMRSSTEKCHRTSVRGWRLSLASHIPATAFGRLRGRHCSPIANATAFVPSADIRDPPEETGRYSELPIHRRARDGSWDSPHCDVRHVRPRAGNSGPLRLCV